MYYKNVKLELRLFLHKRDSPKYLNVLICLSSKTFSFYIFQRFKNKKMIYKISPFLRNDSTVFEE
jgi:hypothetical protein